MGLSARVLTTHVGSLPRPDGLLDANDARERATTDEQAFDSQLADAVRGVVARQKEIGIDLVNDGEYGHSMGQRYNFGAWSSYVYARLSGFEMVDFQKDPVTSGRPAPFGRRRDFEVFAEAYADPDSGCAQPERYTVRPVARAPIRYTGQHEIQRDIHNLKAALASAGLQDGYLNAIAPGSGTRFADQYYETYEEALYAIADALREEYRAVIDAGLMLQLDDPWLAEQWDALNPPPSYEEYRAMARTRVEALNHSIRGLPAERIRLHLCWGSRHGPHAFDLPLREIVDVMLQADVGSYSFEAGNVRHEHEWNVWREVKLPEGKRLLPGVVSHATNVVEHPELVAQRLVRFAQAVGAENVIASTDCGLGGRVHPQIAWAKLHALVEGAQLAGQAL
jgi:5-methyltetrahydropteroyltriglutamate--homocysteine methyltransferase